METKKEVCKEKRTLIKSIGSALKTAYTMLTCVAILVCLSSATYAWFSTNSVVKTDRVQGRSGTDRVTLQVSQTGGDGFVGLSETGIVQVNDSNAQLLLPVSTADLRHFVYNASTVGDEAMSFEKVENERFYYHGRVYVRATAEGHSEESTLALYLDGANEGGQVVRNKKGYLANAARLGLMFDGGNAKILRVSEESNPTNDQTMNTVLNGEKLTVGQVIDSAGETLKAVGDPSEALSKYTSAADGTVTGNGVTPLYIMKLNEIYAVDIYFYLEGCDPDCSDVTRMDELDLQLAFYGVLTEGGIR